LTFCGFNVLDPNYRGSTGFGLEFQEKIKEGGWGGREQEDIKSGIEALIEQGNAAPVCGMTDLVIYVSAILNIEPSP
jgi:hypothetical protein